MWAALLTNRARGYAKQSLVKLPIDRRIISQKIERALAKSSYEGKESTAARRLLKEGDTVLELGAGLGFMSACIRRETGAGRIVTYEANPDLIGYITRLHKANGIDDIDLRHGVVLAKPSSSTVPFHIRADMWASSLEPRGEDKDGPVIRTVDVPTFAWADVIADVRPDALIMDIEGGELDLLTLCDPGPVRRMVVELHPALHGITGMSRIFRVLEHHGFNYKPGLSNGNVLALERL